MSTDRRAAELLVRRRLTYPSGNFLEIVIWRVPKPVTGSTHPFKYRLALVRNSVCVIRYDNEAGKGDHKHEFDREAPYRFRGLDQLMRDFLQDAAEWERNE